MRIAVPIAGGRVSAHFGHCDQFGLFDTEDSEIRGTEYLSPPAHEPGVFPRWLKEQGADTVISGGMGRRAQQLFSDQCIRVEFAAPDGDPEETVKSYLRGSLAEGDNRCDH